MVDGTLTYRYGKALGDDELAAFGAYLWQRQKDSPPPNLGSIGRDLPELFLAAELSRATAADPLPRDGWLPDLQIMTARDQAGTTAGLYVTAKGGHNDESHNHNDVGSFIAYLDGLPLIIDVGPETYTAKTFSDQRYDIWTMRSAWHNVPLINGAEQAPGREFAARDVEYEVSEKSAWFKVNLTDVYPPEANIEMWRRTYELIRGHYLAITDSFNLTEARAPMALHFVTNRPVTIFTPDEKSPATLLKLGAFPGQSRSRGAIIEFDAANYEARVTTMEVTDPRLLGIWGDQVHRIEIVAKGLPLDGVNTIRIRPSPKTMLIADETP